MLDDSEAYKDGFAWALCLFDEDPRELRVLAIALAKVRANAEEDLARICADVSGGRVLVKVPYGFVLERLKEVPVVAGRMEE